MTKKEQFAHDSAQAVMKIAKRLDCEMRFISPTQKWNVSPNEKDIITYTTSFNRLKKKIKDGCKVAFIPKDAGMLVINMNAPKPNGAKAYDLRTNDAKLNAIRECRASMETEIPALANPVAAVFTPSFGLHLYYFVSETMPVDESIESKYGSILHGQKGVIIHDVIAFAESLEESSVTPLDNPMVFASIAEYWTDPIVEGEDVFRNSEGEEVVILTGDTRLKKYRQAFESINVDIRYNTRSSKYEFDFGKTGVWEVETDRMCYRIETDDIPNRCHVPRGKGSVPFEPKEFHKYLASYTWDKEHDPMLIYLNSLPKPVEPIDPIRMEWVYNEGTDLPDNLLEIDRALPEMWEQSFESVEKMQYETYVMRSIVLGAIYRTLQPGCEFQQLPILKGEPRIGKDTFIEQLCFDNDLYQENFDFTWDAKRKVEQTLGKVLVACSEQTGLTNSKDINAIKSYISRSADEMRLSYGRRSEKHKRRFVIVSTTNEDKPVPRDPTGTRRFFPVVIQLPYDPKDPSPRRGIDPKVWLNEEIESETFGGVFARREVIWAEAMAIADHYNHRMLPITPPAHVQRVQAIQNIDLECNGTNIEQLWEVYVGNVSFDTSHPLNDIGVASVMSIVTDERSRMQFSTNARMGHIIRDLMIGIGWENKRVPLSDGDPIMAWVGPECPYHSQGNGDRVRYLKDEVYGMQFWPVRRSAEDE